VLCDALEQQNRCLAPVHVSARHDASRPGSVPLVGQSAARGIARTYTDSLHSSAPWLSLPDWRERRECNGDEKLISNDTGADECSSRVAIVR
jgi:hypothetical protein